jgi:hypothetical protein
MLNRLNKKVLLETSGKLNKLAARLFESLLKRICR